MFVTVVATLCLAGACVDKTVTEQATFAECMTTAPPFIAQWMADEGYTARGYRLDRWRCQMGKRSTAT